MLSTLLAANLFGFMLVLARVGTALMLLPGFGDAMVLRRFRLLLALLLSGLILPLVAAELPPVPASPLMLAVLTFGETLIGALIGVMARLVISAVDVAGMIVSLTIGLSSAQVFNPALASQGSLISGFMTIVALVLIFVTDLHHLMLRALVGSYGVFPVGELPPVGDAAQTISRLVADSFRLGAEIAAPFLVIGMVLMIGMGLLARLMPQIQIFFIALPVQITFGIALVGLTLSGMMLVWLEYFQDSLIGLLPPA